MRRSERLHQRVAGFQLRIVYQFYQYFPPHLPIEHGYGRRVRLVSIYFGLLELVQNAGRERLADTLGVNTSIGHKPARSRVNGHGCAICNQRIIIEFAIEKVSALMPRADVGCIISESPLITAASLRPQVAT